MGNSASGLSGVHVFPTHQFPCPCHIVPKGMLQSLRLKICLLPTPCKTIEKSKLLYSAPRLSANTYRGSLLPKCTTSPSPIGLPLASVLFNNCWLAPALLSLPSPLTSSYMLMPLMI